MAGVMTRSDFRKQLQLGLNSVFGMEYDRHHEVWKEYLDIETSDKAYEEDVLQVGLGAANVKPEGSGVQYDAGAEAWVQRYTHDTVTLAFAITEEAIEDGLYGDQGRKYSAALATSMQHTHDVKAANLLNNGFDATNFAIGDAVAFFSTAHPLWNGATMANKPTTDADFSEASLEDALVAIDTWTDDRGIPCALTAVKLIGPPQLKFIFERITATPLRPGSAENDVNAHRNLGMLPGGYVTDQRLTDTNAWFVKTDCPDGMKNITRISIQRGMQGDFETGNLRFKARERYSVGVTNWRAAYGSSGGS